MITSVPSLLLERPWGMPAALCTSVPAHKASSAVSAFPLHQCPTSIQLPPLPSSNVLHVPAVYCPKGPALPPALPPVVPGAP